MAAVIATMSGLVAAEPHDLVGEAAGPVRGLRQLDAGDRVEGARPVQVVELVVFGRAVAEALAGDAVHDDRAAEAPRAGQCDLDGGDVVPVDRPDVLQAEVFEESLRGEHVLEPALDAVQCVEQRFADERRAAEHFSTFSSAFS